MVSSSDYRKIVQSQTMLLLQKSTPHSVDKEGLLVNAHKLKLKQSQLRQDDDVWMPTPWFCERCYNDQNILGQDTICTRPGCTQPQPKEKWDCQICSTEDDKKYNDHDATKCVHCGYPKTDTQLIRCQQRLKLQRLEKKYIERQKKRDQADAATQLKAQQEEEASKKRERCGFVTFAPPTALTYEDENGEMKLFRQPVVQPDGETKEERKYEGEQSDLPYFNTVINSMVEEYDRLKNYRNGMQKFIQKFDPEEKLKCRLTLGVMEIPQITEDGQNVEKSYWDGYVQWNRNNGSLIKNEQGELKIKSLMNQDKVGKQNQNRVMSIEQYENKQQQKLKEELENGWKHKTTKNHTILDMKSNWNGNDQLEIKFSFELPQAQSTPAEPEAETDDDTNGSTTGDSGDDDTNGESGDQQMNNADEFDEEEEEQDFSSHEEDASWGDDAEDDGMGFASDVDLEDSNP